MRNIEIIAHIQQEHLISLNLELLKPENEIVSQYLRGRINELESQIRLLSVLIEQEVTNA